MDKAEELDVRQRIANLLQHVPGGGMLFAVLLLVVLGYFGWKNYGADHLDIALYSLQYENLKVTPQPAWIKSNVAEEVFEKSRLDRISLLEQHATSTIAQAFETHPWVKATLRVSKAVGNSVSVELAYRRPIAMIYGETEVRSSPSEPPKVKEGFVPVDEECVILPTQDFSDKDPWSYFMIFAKDTRPAGSIVGMPYSDGRIADAVVVCRLLEPLRETYDLQFITVDHDGIGAGPSPWIFRVETRDRSREIVWGHIPGILNTGEPLPEEKLQRMVAWLKETNTAHPGSEVQTIDLRYVNTALPVSSRTQP